MDNLLCVLHVENSEIGTPISQNTPGLSASREVSGLPALVVVYLSNTLFISLSPPCSQCFHASKTWKYVLVIESPCGELQLWLKMTCALYFYVKGKFTGIYMKPSSKAVPSSTPVFSFLSILHLSILSLNFLFFFLLSKINDGVNGSILNCINLGHEFCILVPSCYCLLPCMSRARFGNTRRVSKKSAGWLVPFPLSILPSGSGYHCSYCRPSALVRSSSLSYRTAPFPAEPSLSSSFSVLLDVIKFASQRTPKVASYMRYRHLCLYLISLIQFTKRDFILYRIDVCRMIGWFCRGAFFDSLGSWSNFETCQWGFPSGRWV